MPEARGRGFARSLVGHAAALARAEAHQLIFIVADEDDWPKHLYGRVGFEPIGRTKLFHRDIGHPDQRRTTPKPPRAAREQAELLAELGARFGLLTK